MSATIQWCVAVAVVRGSPVAARLREPVVKEAFLSAAHHHMSSIGLPGCIPKHRPLFNSTSSPSGATEPSSLLQRQLVDELDDIDCSDWFSLFVAQPSDPLPRAAADSTGNDVDYKYFSSGRDALGPWRVDPLGSLVLEVVVGRRTSPAVLLVTEVDVPPHGIPANEQLSEFDISKLTTAERDLLVKREAHKFQRFIDHYLGRPSARLEETVLRTALSRASQQTNNPELMGRLHEHLMCFTNCRLAPPRGAFLWGPPGTAKTSVAVFLVSNAGFVNLRVDGGVVFAAGEMRGGIVGETERRVKALLRRPQSCPWLQFACVIDEIETLLKNRNDTRGGGNDTSNSSGLGVFLSFFEDHVVPNLFMFAATNLKLQVDEAAIRRFDPTGLFYVGLPPATARLSWSPRTPQGAYDAAVRLPQSVRQHMALITMNFSGANMKSLMQALQAADHQASPKRPLVVTEALMSKCVEGIAIASNKLFAGKSLVSLMRLAGQGADASVEASAQWERFEDDFGCLPTVVERYMFGCSRTERTDASRPTMTGMMLLDLSPLSQLDRIRVSASPKELSEEGFDRCPTLDIELSDGTVHMMRPQGFGRSLFSRYQPDRSRFYTLFAQTALALDLSALLVVDSSYFDKKGASDQEAMRAVLREEEAQLTQYGRFMLVLDLDVAFIDRNSGPSSPIQTEGVQRGELLGEMLQVARRVAAVHHRDGSPVLHFVVVVSSDFALVERALESLRWPLNKLRLEQHRREHVRSQPVRCVKCGVLFCPAESEVRFECKPHTQPLICKLDPSNMAPGESARLLGLKTYEQVVSGVEPHRKDTFVWNCCGQPYNASLCTALTQARPHVAPSDSSQTTMSRSANSRDSSSYHEYPCRAVGAGDTQCWCNACGVPSVAKQCAEPLPECARCPCGVLVPQAGEKYCVPCRNKRSLATYRACPEVGTAKGRWFALSGGVFHVIDNDALAACCEANYIDDGNPPEVRWTLPWDGPSGISSLLSLKTPFRVHQDPVPASEALSLLPRAFAADPQSANCYLACRCKSKGACKCTISDINKAGVIVLARLNKNAFDAVCLLGQKCSDPTLEHRLSEKHS